MLNLPSTVPYFCYGLSLATVKGTNMKVCQQKCTPLIWIKIVCVCFLQVKECFEVINKPQTIHCEKYWTGLRQVSMNSEQVYSQTLNFYHTSIICKNTCNRSVLVYQQTVKALTIRPKKDKIYINEYLYLWHRFIVED